jgi:hypothetical protein
MDSRELTSLVFEPNSKLEVIAGFSGCSISTLQLPSSLQRFDMGRARPLFIHFAGSFRNRLRTELEFSEVLGSGPVLSHPIVGVFNVPPVVQGPALLHRGNLGPPHFAGQFPQPLAPFTPFAPNSLNPIVPPVAPAGQSAPFGFAFPFANSFRPFFHPSKPHKMYCLEPGLSWSPTFRIEKLAAFLVTLPFIEVLQIRRIRDSENFHVLLDCANGHLNLFHLETAGHHLFQMELRHSCPCLYPFWKKRSFFGTPPWKPNTVSGPASSHPYYHIDCSNAWTDIQTEGHYPRVASLSKITHAICHHQGLDLIEHQWFNCVRFSESNYQRWNQQRGRWGEFKELVKGLEGSGFVRVRVQQVARLAFGDIGLDGFRVVSLTWIPRWAPDAFEKASYIQLDCSFKPSRPYVYCAPQAIIRNEAIPLGFIMTPTERQQTYEWFYDDLSDMTGEPPPLKPILSDEGLGLINFGLSGRTGAHFFCYRHLIEKFGARSLLGILAKRILRIRTPEDFQKAHKQAVADLERAFSRNFITAQQRARFLAFIGGLDGTEYRHGIWQRSDYGISTCSNHAERFHRTVNKRVKKFTTLNHRIAVLVEVINEKFEKYQSENHRQLRHVIKGLREKKALRDPDCQRTKCVQFRDTMANRFGCDTFPCKHTVTEQTYFARDPDVLELVPTEFKVDTRELHDISWPTASHQKVDKVRGDLDVTHPYSDSVNAFVIQIVKEVGHLLPPNQRFTGDAKYSFLMEVAYTLKNLPMGDDEIGFRAGFTVEAWKWAMERPQDTSNQTGFYESMMKALGGDT